MFVSSPVKGFFFFFFNYLFLVTQGLCYCEQAFSSCSKQGLLFIAVEWLLIAVASLDAEHRCMGFSSCDTQALRHVESSWTRD